MVQMTMIDAAVAMGGKVVRGSESARFSGAVLDSRAVRAKGSCADGSSSEPGPLFFALEGAAADGHQFVDQALAAGAAGAVVRRSGGSSKRFAAATDGVLIEVEDTYEALHALTRSVRRTTPRHLIAITGSAGKTTTKELLAAMLSERFEAAPSPGNLNNLFGFPLALLSIPNHTEWMVAEMGMSTPGELAGVSRLGKPDIGVFTNVRCVHVEAFENLVSGEPDPGSGEQMITDAKAELLEGLDPDAVVIVNAEDPNTVEIARRHLDRGQGRVLGFARQTRRSRTDRLHHGPTESSQELSIEIPLEADELGTNAQGHQLLLRDRRSGDEVKLFLPLYGTVNIENFLAAATCAHHLGVGLEGIADAVREATLPKGRGSVLATGDTLIIDDSYNSNPSALERALRSAAQLVDGGELTCKRRLWAVLGEMRELGSESAELHRSVGELAGALGFGLVVGVGELARELLAGASDAGARVRWFADASQAQATAEGLQQGDVVLVKGSRTVGLEVVVEALRARANALSKPTVDREAAGSEPCAPREGGV